LEAGMFERYTERARRVIFFARYEASRLGSETIEVPHLLLGLLREDKVLAHRFLPSPNAIESIRGCIEQHTKKPETISTSVDLPLSQESKRVLTYAAEESDRLSHKHIGAPHLLLGMLREKQSFTAGLLQERGLKLAPVREEVARLGMEARQQPDWSKGEPPAALVEALLAWEGVTVAAMPTVGAHSPDFGIYVGNAAETDGDLLGTEHTPPLTTSEHIAHLRAEIKAIACRIESAIAQHDFSSARSYSDQEQKLRDLLRKKFAQQPAGDTRDSPAPILCIEIVRDRKFSDLQRHCDECLAAGAEQVWLLDAASRRAYTATGSEGIREFKGELLQTPAELVLVLDLTKIFA
jgi:hypothetical protein